VPTSDHGQRPSVFERRVVDGLHVFERRSPTARETVICVHGALDRGQSFARLARRLRDYHVIAYDRRGYQTSRDLQPLSLSHHARDLSVLADGAQADGPVIVFGHSFGGVVAVTASAQSAGLFDALIVYEPPLPWIWRGSGGTGQIGSDPQAEAERFFRRHVSDSAWERMSTSQKASRAADGVALVNDLEELRGPAPFDVRQLLAPLSYGYGDVDATREEYYVQLTTALSKAVTSLRVQCFEHTGHGAHLSSPDLMANFIDHEWRARRSARETTTQTPSNRSC
jgi:pimeloyl-ACP methyl ester carboxylesterase